MSAFAPDIVISVDQVALVGEKVITSTFIDQIGKSFLTVIALKVPCALYLHVS